MNQHSNHLIKETSPYLLQHAHNPVNWYPWGEEALAKARKEDKPILVSIGYAACHWCHVMEKESFEDESTAEFMNEHFVNIKIDREERPDLDHIYMDAVQAMTGSGGWPLNVFLTPATKPFYGGTYFPPVKAFNRASWKEVLAGVAQAYKDKREEIETQADNLTTHLIQSNGFGLQEPGEMDSIFSMANADAITENCLKTADKEWGGFGKAPKFPQSFTIRYLLRYYHVKKKENAHQEMEWARQGLDQALLSLDKMIDGGIYDQLGGGFARYSTDAEWLAPHFEKMLYDNALLIDVLSEAHQLTGTARYAEVIHETMDFIKRELMHAQNGFYAALDADSEGEEGKFYVWEKNEVELLLRGNASVFCEYYDITEKGNFHEPGHRPGSGPGSKSESETASGPGSGAGSKSQSESGYWPRPRTRNILRVKTPWEEFATQYQLDPQELRRLLDEGKNILLDHRNKRIRPALDDKIILGWNALMNKACSKAYAATGKEEYRQLAIANMEFLWKNLAGKEAGEFYHTWKNGQAKYPAFLDDYAFLADALLHLQEVTGDTSWLLKATEVTEYAIQHFSEPDTGFFFYTREGQEDIIVRKKEVYDGAVPSGNAVMATNLYKLGLLLDRRQWKERSDKMVGSLGHAVVRHPTSFGCWAAQLLERTAGTVELAIVGQEKDEMHRELLRFFIPHRVLMVFTGGDSPFPLLAGKEAAGPVEIFVCKDFACLQPVTSAEAVMSLINSAGGNN